MQRTDPVRLQVVIPFHQALTTTDADIAQACKTCYFPILDAIEKHENVRLTVHFNGHLLDFLARTQEEALLRLKNLVKRGQLEVLGGLFYGGIPALLPEMDVRGQIEMSGEFWDSFIGGIPQGFWLSELAWTPELPRLLEETGLDYGFISSGQLHLDENRPATVGCIERGGLSTTAFVLNSQLSAALPSRPVDEWVKAVIDRGMTADHHLVNAWVRAESLGLEPGTHKLCMEHGWLEDWIAALGDTNNFEMVLPADTFQSARPVSPLRLRNVCAPELHALGDTDGVVDWTDFPFAFVEVDTIYRRMLRASAKLREAIGIMEDEELEETWSDKLATAQRLVFGAQAPDAYWRSQEPGFTHPAMRDATMARIQRAEAMIDSLVQGEEDWLSTEEEDLDGDLNEEVFVSTRHLMAWLVPGRGGDVRSLDDRASERNILDVGSRRAEPFFAHMEKVPPKGKLAPVGRRGENLVRLAEHLPTEADSIVRRGVRQWIVEADTSPQELFSGSAVELSQSDAAWDVLANGIDEDGDCSYTLSLQSELQLSGIKPRTLQVHKDVNIPIDAPTVRFDTRLKLQGGPPVLWALEIPTRLGLDALKLTADGKAAGNRAILAQVTEVRLEAPDGEAVHLEFSAPCDVWWTAVRTTTRDLEGYQAAEQGTIVVPTLRVEGEASLTVTMTVSAKSL